MNTHSDVEEKRAGRTFWDANPCGGLWTNYEEFALWTTTVEPYVLEVLNRYEWTGLRVLEVGCGQGVVLNHLARSGADGFGVDMSRVSIARARAGAAALGQSSMLHVAVADAEQLPFPGACFDAVVSFGVLHHTPNTSVAVQQVRKALKPGGVAIVMLYRSGNPKWWATQTFRAASRLVDWISRRRSRIADDLRGGASAGDPKGTALLELFGVPTMQAFSNRDARAMFDGFTDVRLRNYQPGFRRLADITPLLRPFTGLLSWIDRVTTEAWGFYQVIEARRE